MHPWAHQSALVVLMLVLRSALILVLMSALVSAVDVGVGVVLMLVLTSELESY